MTLYLSPQFVISSILLSITYVVYVVLTGIDKEYRRVETIFNKNFVILKYIMYAFFYIGIIMSMFMLNMVNASFVMQVILWIATAFILTYVVITNYINIQTFRKMKKASSIIGMQLLTFLFHDDSGLDIDEYTTVLNTEEVQEKLLQCFLTILNDSTSSTQETNPQETNPQETNP